MNIARARRRCRNVALAAFFSAFITALICTAAMLWSDGRPTGIAYFDFFASPWMFTDVVLTMVLGIGIWLRNRCCALFLLGYFILNRITMMVEFGVTPGVIISSVFGWYYWLGVKATYAVHRWRIKTEPHYRPMPACCQGVSYGLAGIFIASFGFSAVLQLLPDAPKMRVVTQSQLSQHMRDGLRQAGIISPTERVDMFYSEAVFDYLDAGNILTDIHLISYETVDGIRYRESTMLTDIIAIELVSAGNFFEDTVVSIRHMGGGDGEFLILLPRDRAGDEMFLHRLELRTGLAVLPPAQTADKHTLS